MERWNLKKILNEIKRRKAWKGITTLLAGIVVFVTTYALILPAITLELDVAEDEPGIYLEGHDEIVDEDGTSVEGISDMDGSAEGAVTGTVSDESAWVQDENEDLGFVDTDFTYDDSDMLLDDGDYILDDFADYELSVGTPDMDVILRFENELPKGTQLWITEMDAAKYVDAAESVLREEIPNLRVLRFELEYDGKIIQPEGDVEVNIYYVRSLNAKDVRVLDLGEKPAEMRTSLGVNPGGRIGSVSFITDLMSDFGLTLVEENTQKDGLLASLGEEEVFSWNTGDAFDDSEETGYWVTDEDVFGDIDDIFEASEEEIIAQETEQPQEPVTEATIENENETEEAEGAILGSLFELEEEPEAFIETEFVDTELIETDTELIDAEDNDAEIVETELTEAETEIAEEVIAETETEELTEEAIEAVTEVKEAETEEAVEIETEEVTEEVTETVTEEITEEATETETEDTTEEATEAETEEVTEEATEAETEEVTEEATEAETEEATEEVTEAETEEATEAVTEEVTEAVIASEAETEEITEAVTEAETEEETEVETEEETEEETETETEEATEAETEAEPELYELGKVSLLGGVSVPVKEVIHDAVLEATPYEEIPDIQDVKVIGENIFVSKIEEEYWIKAYRAIRLVQLDEEEPAEETETSEEEDLTEAEESLEEETSENDETLEETAERRKISGDGEVTVTFEDGNLARFAVIVIGIPELEIGNAVIKSVDGIYFPEDINGYFEMSEGAGATDQEVNALIFKSALYLEQSELYENGFDVTVTLPSSVTGKNFRLTRSGNAAPEIEAAPETETNGSEAYETEANESDEYAAEALENQNEVAEEDTTNEIDFEPFGAEENGWFTLTGFHFQTKNFTEFVLQFEKTAVLISETPSYKVTVTYGPEAQIPEDVYLRVEEITDEAETYQDLMDMAAQEVNAAPAEEEATQNAGSEIVYARFFDIAIMHGEEEIEPVGSVEVKIDLPDINEIQDDVSYSTLHLNETGVEVIDSDAEKSESIVFETSLS